MEKTKRVLSDLDLRGAFGSAFRIAAFQIAVISEKCNISRIGTLAQTRVPAPEKQKF